jgi:hypothetical protein
MIIFQNTGEIDMNTVRAMGVSVKAEGNIGFFGTGLKFAIATLLRNQQEIVIFSGTQRYDLGTKTVNIRGKDFEMVTLNGEQIGFTTELGKTWQMWMAFRELHCNCLDEGGETRDSNTDDSLSILVGQEGSTIIAVKGDLINKEFHDRNLNFISGNILFEDEAVQIYAGTRPYLFYKGVRVASISGRVFSYNIKSPMDLTEDRTLKYLWSACAKIAQCVMRMKDQQHIKQFIRAPLSSFERENVEFSASYEYSPEFLEECTKQYKLDSVAINKTVRDLLRNIHPKDLYEEATLSVVQQKQLDKCLAFCRSIGYASDDYKIRIIETLGPTVMAKALRDHDTIILSKQCFDKGTKYLASTLIEEVIHLREGLDDETRSMQTYLFDRIISMGEELQGEPL